MPHIEFTLKSRQDLSRFEQFLQEVYPAKAGEAIVTIIRTIELLKNNPKMGQAVRCSIDGMRKLYIPYGKNGYIAYYVYDENADVVRIETMRHYLELQPFN